MRYSDELIEEVRSRNDIVDVVSQYVRLERRGSNYFGLCPFHSEKTPSFSVTPGKQLFYCFGCGAGGDVVRFVMQYENLTYREAIEELAERGGVPLPRRESSEEGKREEDRRSRLLAANKEAARYYYALLRSGRGRRAMEYFKGRGLDAETMNRFGLGFADQYSDDLCRYMRGKGFGDGELRDAGLAIIDERSGARDKFWNRAMFPIMDARGRVIGFGGRVMGDGEPKYLNSPETLIFDKGRTLYGYNIARGSRREQILLCEGYMDVIALHQAGFDNAVASLGTSFTAGHASVIKRTGREVCLSFDSDGAGVKAALRAIPMLREEGIPARVVDMRPYKDPDEFIKALGADAYQERIDHSENAFMFEMRMLEERYDMKDPAGKTEFANEAARLLCSFSETIERENYIGAVAEKYGFPREDLRRLVNQKGLMLSDQERRRGADAAMRYRGARGTGGGAAGGGEQEARRGRRPDGGLQSQRTLLCYLAEDESAFAVAKGCGLAPEDFSEGVCRKVAEAIFARRREGGDVFPPKIMGMFEDEEEQREVAEIFSATERGDASIENAPEQERERAVREAARRVRMQSLDSRMKSTRDAGELMRLMGEKKKLQEG